MSRLFKTTLLLAIFFGINKVVALVRQIIIAKQFGFSAEIDAFNAANNIPDLLFSLISGGALAMAFIPVLTEYLDKKGRNESWILFSRIANLVFIVTGLLSVIVAVFALSFISSEFGIAPGFNHEQKLLTAQLMQLNLIATLLFSVSGLVMAALQSHKHFLLPAIAPILYNVGQIFGVVVLSGVFGYGVYGLAYGVILGALFHLLIQIPGLVRFGFKWHLSLGLNDDGVKQVLRLLGPRILTVLFIQIVFLTRDNLASRLHEGAVSALTYGYFIMQVPETLIGTAIATALLPTLSHFADQKNEDAFISTLHKSVRVIISLTLVITVVLGLSLQVLVPYIFDFSRDASQLLVLTSQAYLIGLLSQCLLEVIIRAYYAYQDSRTPLIATFTRMVMFVVLAIGSFAYLGAPGLAMVDSITVTFEVVLLFFLLVRIHPVLLKIRSTIMRTVTACVACILVMYSVIALSPFNEIYSVVIACIVSLMLGLAIVYKDVKLMIRL